VIIRKPIGEMSHICTSFALLYSILPFLARQKTAHGFVLFG
jgi:hypothetical protein